MKKCKNCNTKLTDKSKELCQFCNYRRQLEPEKNIVNRVKIIYNNHVKHGRKVIVSPGNNQKFEVVFQDDNKTLKLFEIMEE